MLFVIVGGGGYVGYHLGIELVQKGNNVILYDLRKPDPEWIEGTEKLWEKCKFIQGDILDLTHLEKVFEGADCVFNTVSYGMSGKEMLPSNWDKTESINIEGCTNVIKAASKLGVSALVYTSTVNVVFGGQEIHYGDESLSYHPLHLFCDHYSRTKQIAERIVLASDFKISYNSTQHNNHKPLRTCSLRLAGILGPKEKRHLHRIVNNLWLLKFNYGYGEALVQFVSLKNAVQAHLKAAEELLKNPQVVGGQAYFISDGQPINHLENFRPLIEDLGYTFPRFKLPMIFIWTVAYLSEYFDRMTKGRFDFSPFLLPAEVYKSAVTHNFSNKKAEKDFGYKPESPNDISEIVQYYSKAGIYHKKSNLYFFGLIGILLIMFIYSFIF